MISQGSWADFMTSVKDAIEFSKLYKPDSFLAVGESFETCSYVVDGC